jgi:hypothetical protein
VDREVHAHAVALGEHLVGVDRAGVEAPAQEGAQALEQCRVVAALGQGDDDRRGPPVGVAAPQDAPLLGLQAHERHDRAAQVVGGRGEELVLGEGLEERDRRLVVVRADDQVLAGEDPPQLAVQDGRLGRGLGVRLGGEQADEARLADDLAVGRDPANADVVHAHAAMHGRHPVRLGDQQQLAAQRPLAQAGIERLDRHRLGVGRARLVVEQPEAGAADDAQRAVDQLVVARAEEDEVVARQPLEERDDLGDLVLLVARGARACDLDDRLDALAQLREVAHHAAHVGQHEPHGVLEVGEVLGRQAPVELEVHDRLRRRRPAGMQDAGDAPVRRALGADDRVQDADDAQAAGSELGADGVDEERQVLGVGLEDRTVGLVAVLGERRVERPHRHRGPVARGRELEGAEDLVVEGLRVVPVALGGRRQAAQVRLCERLHRRGAVRRQPLLHELLDGTHVVPSCLPAHPVAIQDAIDQSVLHGLGRGEEAIALHVLVDLLLGLPAVLGEDLVEAVAQGQRLGRVDGDVGLLALEAAGGLVDEHPPVGQRGALARGAADEHEGGRRHRDPAARRVHGGADVLHRVVDGQAGIGDAARGVDVELDRGVGVGRLEVQQLRHHEVGDLVVDGLAEEDDALVQQPRVDVEGPLAARILLDDHGHKGHGKPAPSATIWLHVSCQAIMQPHGCA